MIEIKLICPACRKSHRVTLKSGKSVLLLNCPECRTLLLHYGSATFQVEKSEIKDLSHKKGLKSVHKLMELISHLKEKRGDPRVIRFQPRKVKSPRTPRPEKGRTEPFGKDEILDLIIDIQTSASVTDFLNKLK